MERDLERNLEILTAVGDGGATTQRALAERLGVALGLTNLYLRRLMKMGYVKVSEFPVKPSRGKRLRYLLTPKGIAEKTRLTYAYMERSLAQYRLARQTLRESLDTVRRAGLTRIALYGTGEAAELAWLTLREFGLEPVVVYSAEAGSRFLGAPTRDWRELASAHADVDVIVLASFDAPDRDVPALVAAGVPAVKLLTLRPRLADGDGHGPPGRKPRALENHHGAC